MEKLINDFIEYLHNEKNTSGNTEVSYQRDLKKMAAYFEKQGIAHADEVTESDLKAYVSEMQSADFASSTISRNIASIRALFHYLFKKGVVSEDPSENLRAPRIEKKMTGNSDCTGSRQAYSVSLIPIQARESGIKL